MAKLDNKGEIKSFFVRYIDSGYVIAITANPNRIGIDTYRDTNERIIELSGQMNRFVCIMNDLYFYNNYKKYGISGSGCKRASMALRQQYSNGKDIGFSFVGVVEKANSDGAHIHALLRLPAYIMFDANLVAIMKEVYRTIVATGDLHIHPDKDNMGKEHKIAMLSCDAFIIDGAAGVADSGWIDYFLKNILADGVSDETQIIFCDKA